MVRSKYAEHHNQCGDQQRQAKYREQRRQKLTIGIWFKTYQSRVEKGVKNLRVICHDATEILRDCVKDGELGGLQLFFPDPWHKAKHHKRRIVQPRFVEQVVQKLQPNGFIHMATDWENYAEQMLEVLSANENLVNTAEQDYIPRPDFRPLTKFEARGHRLGHGVWDLYFKKK